MIRFRRILCGHQKFGEFERSVNQFFTRFEKEYEYLITIKQVQRMFEILRENGNNDLNSLLDLIYLVQNGQIDMPQFVHFLGLTRRSVDVLCCVEFDSLELFLKSHHCEHLQLEFIRKCRKAIVEAGITALDDLSLHLILKLNIFGLASPLKLYLKGPRIDDADSDISFRLSVVHMSSANGGGGGGRVSAGPGPSNKRNISSTQASHSRASGEPFQLAAKDMRLSFGSSFDLPLPASDSARVTAPTAAASPRLASLPCPAPILAGGCGDGVDATVVDSRRQKIPRIWTDGDADSEDPPTDTQVEVENALTPDLECSGADYAEADGDAHMRFDDGNGVNAEGSFNSILAKENEPLTEENRSLAELPDMSSANGGGGGGRAAAGAGPSNKRYISSTHPQASHSPASGDSAFTAAASLRLASLPCPSPTLAGGCGDGVGATVVDSLRKKIPRKSTDGDADSADSEDPMVSQVELEKARAPCLECSHAEADGDAMSLEEAEQILGAAIADVNVPLTEGNMSLAELPRLQRPQPGQHVLVLKDGFFIQGIVEAYCQDSKNGRISFADLPELEFSIRNDNHLIFLRGEFGMFCKTCGEEYRRCKDGQKRKADLICTSCKAAFHKDCFSPLRVDKTNYTTPPNWMCPGCARPNLLESGEHTEHSAFRNREWPSLEGSDDDNNVFCLFCGHEPIVVHKYANSEDVEISMDQCVSCHSLVCWNCSSCFLGMSRKFRFKCWDCSADGEYDRLYAIEFLKLAQSVSVELKRKVHPNQVIFDRFAEVMMSLLHNFHANLFQKHLHLLVQVVQYQLVNDCIPSLAPFNILEIMGLHSDINSDLFIKVSKAAASVYEAQSRDRQFPKRPELEQAAKLTVAFFYSDAGNHPTQCLIRSCLEKLSKWYNVLVFSCAKAAESNDYARKDFSQLIESRLIQFIIVDWKKTDFEIAKMLFDHRIMFLIDVNGNTFNARTGVFNFGPANHIFVFLASPCPTHAKYCAGVFCDKYVWSKMEMEASKTHEKMLLMSCYQSNSYAGRFSTHPFDYANVDFARRQEGIPVDCTFVFCCFSSLQKLTIGVHLRLWLDILENTPGSCLWLYSEPVHARKRVIEVVRVLNSSLLPRVIFAPQIPKDLHLKRHELGHLSLSPAPYGSHTTATDSVWSGVPVSSLYIPGKLIEFVRWPTNVSASVMNCALGKSSHFVHRSLLELKSKVEFFAKNPAELQPYREILRDLREREAGIFDSNLHAEEMKTALSKFLESDPSTKICDGRLQHNDARLEPLRPSDLLSGVTEMTNKRSMELGVVERTAISLSEQNTAPGRDDISILGTARVVFEMVKARGCDTADTDSCGDTLRCFIDASFQQQMVITLLAASMGFQQAFALFDLTDLSAYLAHVNPRLDSEKLANSSIGAAFVDFKSVHQVLWPRNAQFVLLSTICENGEKIFTDMASNHLSSTIQVCAVIEDCRDDPSLRLKELNKAGDLWQIFTTFTVSKQNQHGELRVQIFKRLGEPRPGHGRTNALQSDLLLALIVSKTEVGKQLRKELETPSLCSGDLTLNIPEWNCVSLALASSAPELSFGRVLGAGGFGVVIGTHFKGQDCAVKCEISSARVPCHDVSLWRENEYLKSKPGVPFLVECFVSKTLQNFAFGYVSASHDKRVYCLSMQRLATKGTDFLIQCLDGIQTDKRDSLEELRNFAKQFIGEIYIANQNALAVHRDIKPGNVMLWKNKNVMVIDWGQVQYSYMNYADSVNFYPLGGHQPRTDNNSVHQVAPNFPTGQKTVQRIGRGTPGFSRVFTTDQSKSRQEIARRRANQAASPGLCMETMQFKAEVSNRDMYGAGMTLLYTVIPKLDPVKFSSVLSELPAGDFGKFVTAVRLAIPPGTLNTYIDGGTCLKLLDTIFKLFQSEIVKALHSSFILDPIFTVPDEQRLRDGIVVQKEGRKPVVLIYVDGFGLLVFLICYYFAGQETGEYGGRIVDIPPNYDTNSPKNNTTDNPEIFSGHVVPIRGQLLIGDITAATPLDTYIENVSVMSFAQSSRMSPETRRSGSMNLVDHVREPLKAITLKNGTRFGTIRMTARVAGGGIRPATWCYDWNNSFKSSLYSDTEVTSRQRAAAQEFPDHVMKRLEYLRNIYAS